jgi:hypothetical protein
MNITIKRHKTDLSYRAVDIKDGSYIHRYDRPIKSASYMERMLIKSLR